ncbi:prokineticin receptor 2-like [Oppia nitens]|uniref:prokineticin receptor 2-like n=1 Tax=Oppia nitens TaxID=1686743 RepID=UPI0023DA88AD|nr:prokineticin receptor 2-like [Oppia nitens]
METICISNIVCILVVRKTSCLGISRNRPRSLMANICLSDTILSLNSCIFRYIFIPLSLINNTNPIGANIMQSVHNYLENVSLYITSITFIIISMDSYYKLAKVFFNPFNAKSTRFLLYVIWFVSLVLSVPSLVTTYIDLYDYQSNNVSCIAAKSYMMLGMASIIKKYILFRSIVYMFAQFVIPGLLVSWYSGKLIFVMISEFRRGRSRCGSGISITEVSRVNNTRRCHVTKRLVTVLLIFILKNTAYAVVTQFDIILAESNYPCPKSPHYIHFIFTETFRFTTSLNSFIFFWLSHEFRKQSRDLILGWMGGNNTIKNNIPTPRVSIISSQV